MTEGFHYTACGLDYVYLQNGFKVHETTRGKGVSITDAQGLHAVIARAIISSPCKLRGQEVRFLRSMLKLSQDGLGKALRTTRGSVARWEADRDGEIPGTADVALRMFYAYKADGHALAEKIVELLTEIDELEHQIATVRQDKAELFREVEGHWEREAGGVSGASPPRPPS